MKQPEEQDLISFYFDTFTLSLTCFVKLFLLSFLFFVLLFLNNHHSELDWLCGTAAMDEPVP